ncbi:MAG: Ig-like domain-containing protein [Bacillota bacterium]|nr:Ig-like domain-containing protein [Bacillota bacterium]
MNILNKRKVTLFAILTLTLSLGVTSKGRINKKPLEENSVVTKSALVNKPLAKSPGANVVTLTVYNPTVVIPGGQIPQGAGVNFNSTSNLDSGKRLDATYKQTLKVISPNEIHLTNLTLSMKSEVSSGAGSLKYSFDNITYTDIIPTATPFNDPLWYGAWSTTYVDVVKPLDLLVQGDIYFEIEASSDALYNEKFSFVWDYTTPPLTGLTMNKSSTFIVRTYSEQLSVTPTPEGASSSVTWSTSNASVATVSADGLVTGVDGGDAIITATSTVNTSIKTTCQVTVTPHLPGYRKVTNDNELRFGATYTFAKFDTLDAAKFDDSLTYIPQYSATASLSGGI